MNKEEPDIIYMVGFDNNGGSSVETQYIKKGETVKKGDVLVQGWLEGKYTDNRYVHAEGEVIAKVWYTEKEKI